MARGIAVREEASVPVEQRDPRQTIKAVSLGVAAVAAAIGFLVFVLWATDRGGVEIALGDDVFDAGRTDVIARQIDEGGPIMYADLLGGGQNIILNHVGSELDTGWFAFDLIRPGQPSDCQLAWNPDASVFNDSCDPSVEIPAGGGSQPSYPVEISERDRVLINFRSVDSPEADS